MKRTLLGALGLLALCTTAFAQVNTVPAPGLGSGYIPKNTYSSAFLGLVPAASATDVLCIAGSSSRVIRVQRIVVGGSAGTAVAVPITVVRRASADTGGTAGTTTANPGIATQIASRDTGQNANTASTATLISYTANPTINDSAPVYVDSSVVSLALTSTAGYQAPAIFDWSRDLSNNLQVPTLRGAAQQICVNFNAVSVSSGLVTGSVTWTEE